MVQEVSPRRLRQGQTRRWYPGVAYLDGIEVKIVGMASTGTPILGEGYVIELPVTLKIADYPYTHAVAFEGHLR